MCWMNDLGSVCGIPEAMLGELSFISAGLHSLQSASICDQPGSED